MAPRLGFAAALASGLASALLLVHAPPASAMSGFTDVTVSIGVLVVTEPQSRRCGLLGIEPLVVSFTLAHRRVRSG